MAYSFDGACTNQAEEYFSRLRRVEIGIHDHIAGSYLLRHAQEWSWREDSRRQSNGEQVSRVASLAMKRGKSVDFTGYWQRHIGRAWVVASLPGFQRWTMEIPTPPSDHTPLRRRCGSADRHAG